MTSQEISLKKDNISRLAIALTALIGLGFIGYIATKLSASALWLDELATLSFASPNSTGHFIGMVIQDTSPPLYYVLMLFWGKVFGNGIFMTRLPSLMFMAGTALTCLYYGRKVLGGWVPAAIAALLLTAAPGMAQYSMEARAYTMMLFLATALILHTVRLCQQIDDKAEISNDSFFMLAVLGLGLSLTHYFGALAFMITGVYIFAVSRMRGHGRQNVMRVGMYSVAIYAIWISLSYSAVRHRIGEDGIFKDTLIPILETSLKLMLGNIWLAALLLLPGLIALALKRKDALRDHRILLPLLMLFFLPLLAKFASMLQPIMTPRNFLILLPPLCLLAATGVTRILPRAYAMGAGAVMAGLLLWHAVPRIDIVKSEMDLAANMIMQTESCADATIYVTPDLGHRLHHFRYYLPDNDITLITDQQEFDEDTTADIMVQDCPVKLWVIHFGPDRHAHLLPHFHLDADALERIDFKDSWLYVTPGSISRDSTQTSQP